MTPSADDLPLPSLDGLDPQQPNYVYLLEQRLQKAEVMLRAQEKTLHSLLEQQYQATLAAYGKIPGVTTIPLPDFTERVQEGETHLRNILSDTIVSLPTDFQGFREVREAERQIEMDFRERAYAIEYRIRAADDAVTGFRQALTALTKVTRLTDPNPTHHQFPIYILWRNRVYEALLSIPGEDAASVDVVLPARNEALFPSLFRDANYWQRFRKQPGEVKATAYVVTNPSGEVPVDILYTQAALKVSLDYLFGQAEAGKPSSPICDVVVR